MQSAPPVSVRCDGGLPWRGLQAALPALAAFSLAALAAGWAGADVRASPALGFAAAIAVGALAWRRARPRPVQLAWDGQAWSADGDAGALAVTIDLGPALLLRLRPAGGGRVRWIAVAAREAGAALPALRAALYSRPPGPPRAPAPRE